MNIKKAGLLLALCLCAGLIANAQKENEYNELYRPQIHFSPRQHWINDPNGMIYFNHTYHLFFQYYPGASVWGPMHWGHAESHDLIHWKELPAALYPDSLGYIFSGSAVADYHNTSGFGKHGKIPLVAIFTHHDPKGEKAGKNNYQNESLAYSLDNGNTWTKYAGNPVLKNPGIADFRDPKVMWYAKENKWIMTLATKDHITFYSSLNLKTWKKESEFGKEIGAHGGVWECPDLFPLTIYGKTHWVLIVNLNPGGPNGGSATQYFVGQFDGNKFTPVNTTTKWLDYGPDEYAGVTWNNTGRRKIFLGWMSNWTYANQVPTEKWRNAMTIPRELSLKVVDKHFFVVSKPVAELNGIIADGTKNYSNISVNTVFDMGKMPSGQNIIKLHTNDLKSFSIVLSNNTGEEVTIGFNEADHQYFIDRTQSGAVNFNKSFAGVFHSPRIITDKAADLELVVDATSAELFADGGLTVMSGIYFPTVPFDHIKIESGNQVVFDQLKVIPLKSIWK